MKTNPSHTTRYQIRALAETPSTVEVLIYGDIGESWDEKSVSAANFVRELQELDAPTLIVRINSFGGSVPDGLAIYNALRRYPGTVEVSIDGVALSVASLIAMAGSSVRMAENAMMMIHAPWAMAIGNSVKLREQANVLDGFAASMSTSYAQKSGKSQAQILRLLTDNEDHWYTAEEALAEGFVDFVGEPIEAHASFDLGRYQDIPAAARRLFAARTNSQSKPKGNHTMQSEDNVQAAGNTTTRSQRLREKTNQRADLRAQERQELDNMFRFFLDRPEIAALYAEVSADFARDPTYSLDTASKQLLNKLGEGVESVRGAPDSPAGVPMINAMVDALVARATHREPKLAEARPFMHSSIVDMGRQLLESGGRSTRSMSAHQVVDLLLGGTASLRPNALLPHTTSDFPFLLQETGARILRERYEYLTSGIKQLGKKQLADDFRPQNVLGVSEAPELKLVGEGGELTHGSRVEAKESGALSTFGRVFSMTRQAMVNDDLQAFGEVFTDFGVAAAQFEAAYLAQLLTMNSGGGPTMRDTVTLFHASHNNLAASGGAIGIATLGAAFKALRLQKGLNGAFPLNIAPRYLLVPAAQESLALQFTTQLEAQQASNVNPYAGRLTVVVDPRLDAVSTTAWYLAGDPNYSAGLIYMYLSGAEGPQVSTREGWEIPGLEIRVLLDFAAFFTDHRAWYRNPGA